MPRPSAADQFASNNQCTMATCASCSTVPAHFQRRRTLPQRTQAPCSNWWWRFVSQAESSARGRLRSQPHTFFDVIIQGGPRQGFGGGFFFASGVPLLAPRCDTGTFDFGARYYVSLGGTDRQRGRGDTERLRDRARHRRNLVCSPSLLLCACLCVLVPIHLLCSCYADCAAGRPDVARTYSPWPRSPSNGFLGQPASSLAPPLNRLRLV